jgi:hypothetical protein
MSSLIVGSKSDEIENRQSGEEEKTLLGIDFSVAVMILSTADDSNKTRWGRKNVFDEIFQVLFSGHLYQEGKSRSLCSPF